MLIMRPCIVIDAREPLEHLTADHGVDRGSSFRGVTVSTAARDDAVNTGKSVCPGASAASVLQARPGCEGVRIRYAI